MKIGIIGFGSFGKFAHTVLSPHADVYVYDASTQDSSEEVVFVTLENMREMDGLILAVPLSSYSTLLPKLRSILQPDTVLIDVCSVKVKAHELIREYLPDHTSLLVSHPLFGPQSASNGLKGHDIIITDAIGERAEAIVVFCEQSLGLNVHRFSDQEHDRVMAYVHALTFFVARGLSDSQLPALPFKTPSFDALTALVDLDHNHSAELFHTIEQGNPYAADVRQDFIKTLEKLDASMTHPTRTSSDIQTTS